MQPIQLKMTALNIKQGTYKLLSFLLIILSVLLFWQWPLANALKGLNYNNSTTVTVLRNQVQVQVQVTSA